MLEIYSLPFLRKEGSMASVCTKILTAGTYPPNIKTPKTSSQYVTVGKHIHVSKGEAQKLSVLYSESSRVKVMHETSINYQSIRYSHEQLQYSIHVMN